MLTNPQFLAAAAAPSILYGCAISFAALAPFIYMKEFNLSMLAYTLNQGATAAAFAITSTFSGKITEKLGVKTTLQTALILTTSGCTLMMFPQSATMITISMSIFGAGFALIYPIIFAKNIEMFPNLKGTASSAIMGLRYTLCAAMTGIASYIYNDSPATLGVMLFLSSILVVLLMGYIIAGQRGLYDL
jgi:DHA1 family bicyclomycin/chloramphenicol resistance-like MFS transporter